MKIISRSKKLRAGVAIIVGAALAGGVMGITQAQTASSSSPSSSTTTSTATTSISTTTTASTTASTTSSSTAASSSIGSTSNLSITNIVNTTTPKPGSTVTYTVTVNNPGPGTAVGVTATDRLPSGLTFVSASPSTGSYNSYTGEWMIGDMAPATTATLRLSATVNAASATGTNDVITNSAIVNRSDETDNSSSTTNTANTDITIGGTSSMNSSTAPTAMIPHSEMLSIGFGGRFLARGMTVTGVSSSSFQAEIWGITYTVNWNQGDEFLLQNGTTSFNIGTNGHALSDMIADGDTVNVSGYVDIGSPLTVNAGVVRNTSIAAPHFPVARPMQTELNTLMTKLQHLEQMIQNTSTSR